MPLYYFKLVDSRVVADDGTMSLRMTRLHKLKRSSSRDRSAKLVPNLSGSIIQITVSVDGGGGVCTIPLEVT